MRSSLAKDAPKPERLITGAGNDGFTVGRHGQVEDAIRVARQLSHLRQTRVLPNQNLILRVAVGADQLRGMFRPRQIAHLRPRVHVLHRLSR